MLMSKVVLAGVLGVGLLLAAPAASAHHSFAMFDYAKNVTMNGTIKEFQWTNPHAWIQLVVRDPATGKDIEWSIECGSPNMMARQGWKRESLKAGDKVTLVIHPLKTGQMGGSMVSAVVNGVPVGAPGL